MARISGTKANNKLTVRVMASRNTPRPSRQKQLRRSTLRRQSGMQKKANRSRRVFGDRGSSIPLAFSRPLMNPQSTSQVFTGSEIVDFPVVASTDPLGTILFEMVVNPRMFLESRLGKQADLWDMYKVKSFAAELIPSVPTTVAGSYMLGIDPDPKADYAGMSPLNRIKALSNVPGGGIFQMFQPSRAPLQSLRTNEWLFCDPSADEPYKTMAGVMACVLVAPVAGITGNLSLTLKIHYVFEFRGQSLQEPTTSDLTTLDMLDGPHNGYNEILYRVPDSYGLYVNHIYIIDGMSQQSPLPTPVADDVTAIYQYARLVQLGSPAFSYVKFYQTYADALAGAGATALQKNRYPAPADYTLTSPAKIFVDRILA